MSIRPDVTAAVNEAKDKAPSIAKGTFFTITQWNSHRDRSYVGDCLEAMVVDGPFVRVRRHYSRINKSYFTIDLRDVDVRILSEEFVQAVIGE